MFQTEPVLFVQSFGSDVLTLFFRTITQMGYVDFYVAAFLIVIFGIDFRKGFVVLHAYVISGLLTEFLKDFFALPRPHDVDSRVLRPGRINESPFTGMGADSFFGPLPQQVVDYYRARADVAWGLPSGHVTGATVFWAGLAVAFRDRWLVVLAGLLIPLMALSRMYLGRHFVADVLGGLLVGGLVVVLAYLVILRRPQLSRFMQVRRMRIALQQRPLLILAYLLLGPLVLLPLPHIRSDVVAYLSGVNLGFVLVAMRGLPTAGGEAWRRLARVGVAVVVFVAVTGGLSWLADVTISLESAGMEFAADVATAFLTLWGTAEISRALGLYDRPRGKPVGEHSDGIDS